MKQILIPDKPGYKANLHAHTTDSDGALTPEELKELYRSHGYSILAITDHGYMGDRSHLTDENFVVISGYENHLEPTWNRPLPRSTKCYHLCFYAPRPDIIGMVGMTDYYHEFCFTYKKKELCPREELIGGYFTGENSGFGVDNLNRLTEQANALGYLVVLNHPTWSHLDGRDYLGVRGLTALEIYNHGSEMGGYETECGIIYDQMLSDGQRIYCTANDDTHAHPGANDTFGGYNVMYPEALTYEGVFAAMRDGKMYASTGAAFRGISVEGNRVTTGSDDACVIRLITDRYACCHRRASHGLSEVTFDVAEDVKWFRLTAENENGEKAFSRAYFRQPDGMWA